MVSCKACGRAQTSYTRDKQISFHRIPKNSNVRTRWVEFINQPGFEPNKNSFLCSQHFTENCFDRTSKVLIRLRENAVPTIEITRIKYLKSKYEDMTLPQDYAQNSSSTFKYELNKKVIVGDVGQNILSTKSLVVDMSSEKEIEPLRIADSPKSSYTIEPNDTPRKITLKRKITFLAKENVLKSKIRVLQKKISFQRNKLKSVKALFMEIKNKNLIDEEYSENIGQNFGSNKNVFTRLF